MRCRSCSPDPEFILSRASGSGSGARLRCIGAPDPASLCAHHILPFFGRFIVGYIPERTIIGASKIPRIVEVHMRRLQTQEHLAHDVAETIARILEPRGIGVWMGGVHMCMVMRGVEQESSFMETNVLRGEFLNDERTRQEFMSIVNRRGQRSAET